MDFNKLHFRHSLLFLYQKNFNARQARDELMPVFGENCLNERQCYYWFQRFNSGDFSLDDEPRSGRPSELDNNILLGFVRDNPRSNTRYLGDLLNCSHQTVARHLAELNMKKKFGSYVPHRLNADQLEQRVSICTSLLSKKRTYEWLNNIITGDEKWVHYFNQVRKGQWVMEGEEPEPEPKPDLHPKKIMLTVFWDVDGILLFELLRPNFIINAESYCNQLDRLNNILSIERPQKDHIFLLHDNARPHTAKLTREKIVNKLNWEILAHPPYSPDLAPTDYHLFRHLSNHLKEKHYTSFDDLNYDIRSFF